MVIEWLKIKVLPELREQYIQTDAEIWTAALKTYPGFLSKEVWINPAEQLDVVIVIRWTTRAQWKSFPPERLARLEHQFAQAMPTGHQMVETGEYQVRKFAPSAGAQ